MWSIYFGFLLPWIFINVFAIKFRVINFKNPRLVWGSTPIHNFALWARAMKAGGYESQTFTHMHFSMHERKDWDIILEEEYRNIPYYFAIHLAFVRSLWKYDVFFMPANGFFLGFNSSIEHPNILRRLHGRLLKIAKKKIVLMPYGTDAYVYRRVHSHLLSHGLQTSYPVPSRNQKQIAKDVDFWTDIADVVIPGFMAPDGIGRWDVITPSPLIVDMNFWKPSSRVNLSVGLSETVVVGHAPNHRGFKGTEFVVNAVKQLQKEGLKVDLLLIEGRSLEEVQCLFSTKIDILVEQLLFFGHGLNGLEGMASSIPVISNLEDSEFKELLDKYTFFSDCPIVSSNPQKIISTLRGLVSDSERRRELGSKGRLYVERWHSESAAQYLFKNVFKYLEGDSFALKNLYHPLREEIPRERR